MRIRSDEIVFENASGKNLAARLDWPIGPPRAFAIFAHCFTCSKDSKAAAIVSRTLAGHGFAVLRFDFTGLGESEGDFAGTGFSSNVADIVSASVYLEARHAAPLLLVGHSLGGAAVLAAQQELKHVRAVCTIGAPASPAHVEALLHEATAQVRETGEGEVVIGGRAVRIRKALLDDLTKAEHVDSLGGKALLILHSPQDDVVPIENAELIYKRIRGIKSFVSLDDAGHLLSRRKDAEYAGHLLAAWGARYLPPSTLEEIEDTEGEIRVEEWEPPYTNRVIARSHVQLGDEPVKAGGRDAGFTPYEYLLAALGTCTAMTLRMYAQRKELPLDKVSVVLEQEKVHAEDCDDCENKDDYIHEISREITVEGDLTPKQRERLLEIADKCPVHRTLTGDIVIRSRLAE